MSTLSPNAANLAEACNHFALDVYARLREEQSGNIFFSPYGLAAALGLLYAGAAGETAAQIKSVLHLDLPEGEIGQAFCELQAFLDEAVSDGSVALQGANAIWHAPGLALLESYLHAIRDTYQGEINTLSGDAQTDCDAVNAWAAQKTNEKITQVVSPDMFQNLAMLLANAIYFKGNWLSQFDKEQTQDQPFWVTPDSGVLAPMMFQTGAFQVDRRPLFTSIALPYQGENINLRVFLPKEDVELARLEAELTPDLLTKYRVWPYSAFLDRGVETQTYLPKFKFEGKYENLVETLKKLGLINATRISLADFSAMSAQEQAFVLTRVIQKTFVDVNEEGTEAAAVTVMMASFGPPNDEVFKADHPFLFTISEKQSKLILFMGRIVNPGTAAPIPKADLPH